MRADFRIHIHPTQSDAYFNIRFFNLPVHIPIHLRLINRRGEDLRLVRIRRTGREKVLLPKQNEDSSFIKAMRKRLRKGIREWLILRSAEMYLRIGTGNPCRDCILCGAARELLFDIVSISQHKTEAHADVCPDFSNRIFILNLTGIIRLRTVKIILIALKKA